MALHGNASTGDIHIPYNWSYADTAARTGASGFSAGDVGKIARQTDDNSLWLLTATTPTWQRIDGAGAPTAHASSHDGDGADTIASVTTQKTGLMSTADKTKLDLLLNEYEFGGSSGESNTASSTWQQKYRMTKTVDGGRYRIRFGFLWSGASTSAFVGVRVQVDDTTVVWEMADKPRDTYQNGFYGSDGSGAGIEVTLQSGSRTIDIEYRSPNAQDTAYIKLAYLDIAYLGPAA